MKNRIFVKLKNAWNWVCINKIFFLHSFMAWFICPILINFLILLNCKTCFLFWYEYKDVFNTTIGILISYFLLFYGYYFGNHNYAKEKRMQLIKNYYKDIKNCELLINKIQCKLKEELIYRYQNIFDFMNYLNKNNKKMPNLFFIENWKFSKELYTKLNQTISTFKYNYESLKNSINNLKILGLNNKKINKYIAILLKYDNIQDINKNLVNENLNCKIKNELINLKPFLVPFYNYEIEALKQNVDSLFQKIKTSEQNCNNFIRECHEHKHYFINRKNYFLCSTIIRKIEYVIFFNFVEK